MARLLDDLLDGSRVTRGKIELQKKPLRLADVLAHALEIAIPLVEARRHTLHVAYPPDDLLVEGDLDRLAHVVGNLLSNAARYTPEGGAVGVTLARDGADAVVTVSDTGIGIAPEELDRVFVRFWRADAARSRATGGLGVGLAMVREIVDRHGGQVSVSSSPGQGTTFTVRIPLRRDTLAVPQRVRVPGFRRSA
jgi:signal transduction histidine kinase